MEPIIDYERLESLLAEGFDYIIGEDNSDVVEIFYMLRVWKSYTETLEETMKEKDDIIRKLNTKLKRLVEDIDED